MKHSTKSFDFSSSSARMTKPCLSGDTYGLGEYCAAGINGCICAMTTAKGILAP